MGIRRIVFTPLHAALRRRGLHITPIPPSPQDLDDRTLNIIKRVAPHTMTSPERLAALVEATRHIVACRIEGAFVECGVWRGGSMMAVALALLEEGETGRDLYAFDTFEGMPPPDDRDVDLWGNSALYLHATEPLDSLYWCRSTLELTQSNLGATGYPKDRIRFVAGRVEDTIPEAAPARIALLRLDTDWYSSTRHELEHLYPRLQTGGVLILDDYGHWRGARQATDEFMASLNQPPLLCRIDYTARIAVVPRPM